MGFCSRKVSHAHVKTNAVIPHKGKTIINGPRRGKVGLSFVFQVSWGKLCVVVDMKFKWFGWVVHVSTTLVEMLAAFNFIFSSHYNEIYAL